MPSNNKCHKWPMNSEYGSDCGVFIDGLRNTTIHGSHSFSRCESESYQVRGSGHCSTAAFDIRHATRHETQCEKVARHRHQLHATDFLQITYDWCGNYKRLCQQWRGMYTSWTALSNNWLVVQKPLRTWCCAYAYSFTYDLKYLNTGHTLKSSVLSRISSSTYDLTRNSVQNWR